MHSDRAELCAVVELQASVGDATKAVRLLQDRVKYWREISGRRIDDLQHRSGRGLPLVGLLQLAGESGYPLLQVSNGRGCGRYFASLGPIRAPTLDRLFASTALPHFAPLGWVTTRLKLIQILGFVPWQVWLCHSVPALLNPNADIRPVP